MYWNDHTGAWLFLLHMVSFYATAGLVRLAGPPRQASPPHGALWRVLLNQSLLGFLLLGGDRGVAAMWCAAEQCPAQPAPTTDLTLGRLAVLAFLTDMLFWGSHWLAHRCARLRRFHAQHHRWHVPCGMAALDAHPLDFLVSNLGSMAAALWLVDAGEALCAVWVTVSTINTVCVHSGFRTAHRLHHERHGFNFGAGGVVDRLLQTRAT
jgi:sterol desaturase/sphingolipid hydroxylase (fatty acid hydroxylase superfamily)